MTAIYRNRFGKVACQDKEPVMKLSLFSAIGYIAAMLCIFNGQQALGGSEGLAAKKLLWVRGCWFKPCDHKAIKKFQEDKMNEQVKDLNLLLLYLTAWEEDSRKNPGQKLLRSWKGFRFEILNEFEQRKLITQHRKSRSVVFTQEGKRMAEEIKKRYFSS